MVRLARALAAAGLAGLGALGIRRSSDLKAVEGGLERDSVAAMDDGGVLAGLGGAFLEGSAEYRVVVRDAAACSPGGAGGGGCTYYVKRTGMGSNATVGTGSYGNLLKVGEGDDEASALAGPEFVWKQPKTGMAKTNADTHIEKGKLLMQKMEEWSCQGVMLMADDHPTIYQMNGWGGMFGGSYQKIVDSANASDANRKSDVGYVMNMMDGTIEGLRGKIRGACFDKLVLTLWQALSCLKHHNVEHMDIKPANILYEEEEQEEGEEEQEEEQCPYNFFVTDFDTAYAPEVLQALGYKKWGAFAYTVEYTPPGWLGDMQDWASRGRNEKPPEPLPLSGREDLYAVARTLVETGGATDAAAVALVRGLEGADWDAFAAYAAQSPILAGAEVTAEMRSPRSPMWRPFHAAAAA